MQQILLSKIDEFIFDQNNVIFFIISFMYFTIERFRNVTAETALAILLKGVKCYSCNIMPNYETVSGSRLQVFKGV